MESTRAMTCECGSRAESKNCEIHLLSTADRRLTRKSNASLGGGPHFESMQVKCPGIAQGKGGLAVLELTGILLG